MSNGIYDTFFLIQLKIWFARNDFLQIILRKDQEIMTHVYLSEQILMLEDDEIACF